MILIFILSNNLPGKYTTHLKICSKHHVKVYGATLQEYQAIGTYPCPFENDRWDTWVEP